MRTILYAILTVCLLAVAGASTVIIRGDHTSATVTDSNLTVGIVDPMPSPTPTPSPTATVTPTPTPTAIPTPPPVPTFTPAPTVTPTVTPTPGPSVTPTPEPTPGDWTPDPQYAYHMPTPLDVASVTTWSQFQALVKSPRWKPGLEVRFGPGDWPRLDQSELPACGTTTEPIVLTTDGPALSARFVGGMRIRDRRMVADPTSPTSKVRSDKAHDIHFVGLAFEPDPAAPATQPIVAINEQCHDLTLAGCRVRTLDLSTPGIKFYGHDGDMAFERIRIAGCEIVGVWRPGLNPGVDYRGASGVSMANWEPPGGYLTITGNRIHGFHDGIGLSEVGRGRTDHGMYADNAIWACVDDYLQIEGQLTDTRILGNIVGGSDADRAGAANYKQLTAKNGIAVAPYGRNMLIEGNSVSGFFESAVKWHTDIGGPCSGLTVVANLFRSTPGLDNSVLSVTSAGNLDMTGLRFSENTFLCGRRAWYTNSPWPSQDWAVDYNDCHFDGTLYPDVMTGPWSLWSTIDNMTHRFRTLEDLQSGFGWEAHGTVEMDYGQWVPVQVLPDVPVELLCTWELPPVVSYEPTGTLTEDATVVTWGE